MTGTKVRRTEAGAQPLAPAAGEASARPSKRPRRGLKRTVFQVPKAVPAPVRALWKSASPAERERAHKTATTVLKAWLGLMSREEAARELGLTPLRFWQISQQAVAGLVAGCLRQPRFRGRADLGTAAEPVALLKRRILVLEREVEAGRRLIGVLRELPGHREVEARTRRKPRHGRRARGGRQNDGAAAQAGEGGSGGPAAP
jgi:hypothetical protein